MSEESKLAAAVDRLTAAIKKQTEMLAAGNQEAGLLRVEMRETREQNASQDFDLTASVAGLLTGLGGLATGAGLKLLTDDEPPAFPSRGKKRRAV